MNYFKYGEEEMNYLKANDPILGKAIDEMGFIKRPVEQDVFQSLIGSIIGQQISTKAANTVRERFRNLVGLITPENIIKTDAKAIQQCGMSLRKVEYIRGIAQAAVDEEINFDELTELSNKEVIKELTKLRGVGEWTAEMLLIHALHRPNIISYNDLGIRRGMMRLYQLDDLSKKEFDKYKKQYEPFSTTASIYLWEISKN